MKVQLFKTKWLPVLALWIILLCAGFYVLVSFESKPGEVFTPPKIWPEESTLSLSAHKASLFVFIHPKCSCSEATLEELDKIRTHVGALAEITAVFYQPISQSLHWHQGKLYKKAQQMGIHIVADIDGIEGQRFYAKTSGSTVLYNKHGELLFQGGITGSRGHAGDNDGNLSIIAIIEGENSVRHTTNVYGCPIFNSAHRIL